MPTRIMVTQGYERETEHGAIQRFRGGSFYQPPEDARQELLEKGVAYEEGDPPQASDGREFTGRLAHERRDDYERRLYRQNPLRDVPFASQTARDLAEEANLERRDFAGHEPSGETGYTADDIREVAS